MPWTWRSGNRRWRRPSMATATTLKPGSEALMRHLPRGRSKHLVSAPSLIVIVIAFEISGDVALLSPSYSSGYPERQSISPEPDVRLQINSKGEQVLCRKHLVRKNI